MGMNEEGYQPVRTHFTRNFREPRINRMEVAGQEMALAAQLLERWGMVQGMDDGEDSAGRQKLRLATPEEVVERALACAQVFWQRSRELGFVINLPPALFSGDEETWTESSGWEKNEVKLLARGE